MQILQALELEVGVHLNRRFAIKKVGTAAFTAKRPALP